MAALASACGSGLVTTDGGGASAVGAAAGAALSRSDALSPVADATVAASLVGDGSKTQRIGMIQGGGVGLATLTPGEAAAEASPSFPATAQNGGRPRDRSGLALRTSAAIRKRRAGRARGLRGERRVFLEAFYVGGGGGRALRSAEGSAQYGLGVACSRRRSSNVGRGWGEGPAALRHVPGVVGRPAVAEMRSLRSAFCLGNRGFCGAPPWVGMAPACARGFAETITGLHVAGVKVPGLQVPKAQEDLSGPWRALRLGGPAALPRVCRAWPRASAPFLSGCLSPCGAGSHDGCASPALSGGGQVARSPAGSERSSLLRSPCSHQDMLTARLADSQNVGAGEPLRRGTVETP